MGTTKLLPAKGPGLTAAQLTVQLSSAGYTTSKRTVERDLIEPVTPLSTAMQRQEHALRLVLAARQKRGVTGHYAKRSTHPATPEKSLRPLIPAYMLSTLEPRFNLAHGKLEAMAAENESARWIEKVASVQPEITSFHQNSITQFWSKCNKHCCMSGNSAATTTQPIETNTAN